MNISTWNPKMKASSLRFLLLLSLTAPMAWGALGRDLKSVDDDRAQMQSTVRSLRKETAYSVHELKNPTGTLVREYVSSSGQVFGVAWQGPWLPNFRQILGDYFDPIMNTPRPQRQGRGALVIKRPEVVFQSGGHMRSFFGRAYVPGLLPTGVTADVVQ